jgi:hypothetical protein
VKPFFLLLEKEYLMKFESFLLLVVHWSDLNVNFQLKAGYFVEIIFLSLLWDVQFKISLNQINQNHHHLFRSSFIDDYFYLHLHFNHFSILILIIFFFFFYFSFNHLFHFIFHLLFHLNHIFLFIFHLLFSFSFSF